MSEPLPNIETFAAAVEAAPSIIPPLEDGDYETLPVERLDKFIETRKRRAKESRDPAELRRLNDELNRLFNARAVAVARESKETPAAGAVIVEGVEYLMPAKLTMGETADVEQLVGGDTSGAGVRLMLGMTWVALRRRDPSWTLERVRALDFDAVQVIEGDAGPPAEAPAA